MNELMIPVERAVRPVRASGRRKLRMREELLAHLTAVYEQERAELRDDSLALHRAVQRFGDPANLTRELQSTVPAVERILFTSADKSGWEWRVIRWFMPRAGESAIRHSVRLAAYFAGCFLVLMCLTTKWQSESGESLLAFNTTTTVFLTVHALVSTMLFVGFLHAVSGRLTRRSLFAAVACGAALFVTGPLMDSALTMLGSSHPLPEMNPFYPEDQLPRKLLFGAFLLAVYVAMFRVLFRAAFTHFRRTQDWMNLEIDG
jgi:hypothetical protein